MDIYQIILTHNRKWSVAEMIVFAAGFLIITAVLALLLIKRKIVLSQMISGLLLTVYLGVVFASTVFYKNSGWNLAL